VKSIVLANYERYSSHTKDFNVAGRSTTVGEYVNLGTYSAQPLLNKQAFQLTKPTWARYLKIQFLTHYGSEDYCTMSQISVHGSTMLQGFHEQWGDSEEDTRSDTLVPETIPTTIAANVKATTTLETEHSFSDDTETEQMDMFDNTCDILHSFSSTLHFCPSSLMTEFEKKILSFPCGMVVAAGSIQSGDVDLNKMELDVVFDGTDGSRGLTGIDKSNSTSVHQQQDRSHDQNLEDDDNNKPGAERLKDLGSPSLRKGPNDGAHNGPNLQQAGAQNPDVEENVHTNDEGERNIVLPVSNTSESVNESIDTRTLQQNERKNEIPYKVDANVERKSVTEYSLTGQDAVEGSVLWGKSTIGDLNDKLHNAFLRFPSATCIEKLDFSKYKSDILSAKALFVGSHGNAPSTTSMEPIFKKLADEIRALQASMGVHDQFIKEVVLCYQSIVLDLIAEMEVTRINHEMRIENMETVRSAGLWASVLFDYEANFPSLTSCLYKVFVPLLSQIRSTTMIIVVQIAEFVPFVVYDRLSYTAMLLRWIIALLVLGLVLFKLGYRVVWYDQKRLRCGKPLDDTSFSSDSYGESHTQRRLKSKLKFRNRPRLRHLYMARAVNLPTCETNDDEEGCDS
jgi:Sad1 / UNC-like C-terminal